MTAEYLEAPLPAPSAAAPPPSPPPLARGGRVGALQEFWASFRANHGAVAGVTVIAAIVLLAAFADLIAPHSPVLNDNAAFLKPPFWQDGGSVTSLPRTNAIGPAMLSPLIYGPPPSPLLRLPALSPPGIAPPFLPPPP